MSISKAEKKELTRLAAQCLDDQGKPRPGCAATDLQRLQYLLAKDAGPGAEVAGFSAQSAGGHVLSEAGKDIVDEGGEYLGHTAETMTVKGKPVLEVTEYFYVTTAGVRQAVFVRRDKATSCGRTFSPDLLARMAK